MGRFESHLPQWCGTEHEFFHADRLDMKLLVCIVH
jgi:hypothetical protein